MGRVFKVNNKGASTTSFGVVTLSSYFLTLSILLILSTLSYIFFCLFIFRTSHRIALYFVITNLKVKYSITWYFSTMLFIYKSWRINILQMVFWFQPGLKYSCFWHRLKFSCNQNKIQSRMNFKSSTSNSPLSFKWFIFFHQIVFTEFQQSFAYLCQTF